MKYDPTVLPENLPVPDDDGGAAHLEGRLIPPLYPAEVAAWLREARV